MVAAQTNFSMRGQIMKIRPEQTVAEITRQFPVSTRVFDRHRINFCCGGKKMLQDACEDRGVEVDEVVDEIIEEIDSATPSTLEGWADRPIPDLVEHILENYHRPLDDELPRLFQLATKVARVHGKRDERLPQIAATFETLCHELMGHFQKEEEILFPLLLSDQPAQVEGPISAMLREHDIAGDLLRRLRELTGDYEVPDGACASWRVLWVGLEDLERSLHEHIHLENNILFPRVRGEKMD